MYNFPSIVGILTLPKIFTGKKIFVSSDIGSDSFDGSIDSPFQTLQQAVDECSGRTHDWIFLLPSSLPYDDDSVIAASLDTGKTKRLINTCIYVNKPFVHIIGLQNPFEWNVVLTPSAAASAGMLSFGASADYCSVSNLTFNLSANGAITVASGTRNLSIIGCAFIGGTHGIDMDAGDCQRALIQNCYFEDQTTYGLAIHSTSAFLKDLIFTTPGATAATAMLYVTGAAPSSIENVHCNGNASASVGFLCNNVAGVLVRNSTFANCIDNVSIGAGAASDIIWCLSESGGQGAAAMGSVTITS